MEDPSSEPGSTPKRTQVYLQDDIPKFGSGWRPVIVESIGHKWVRLRNPGNNRIARIRRSQWVYILSQTALFGTKK